MKIEKLPSGNYRIRKMYLGKMHSIVFDYKPTQKEAIQAMAKKLDKAHGKYESMTFKAAAEEYIKSKYNILSPSTIRGYAGISGQLSESFLCKNVHDITVLDIQTEINHIAKGRSPKTVRNYHGFMSAVLGSFCQNLNICTTLPQKVKDAPYIPSDDDIRKILERAKDTKYEVPLVLACYGMRRSEICALTSDDIDGDVVRINKAKVQNEKKEWVIKSTKTTASTREIVIPMEVAKKIQETGRAFKGTPGGITSYLYSEQDKLGIRRFSVHKLRHYFASKMSAMNVPEADILRMGGWESDHVMKSVYRHSMMERDKDAKREAAGKLRNILFS